MRAASFAVAFGALCAVFESTPASAVNITVTVVNATGRDATAGGYFSDLSDVAFGWSKTETGLKAGGCLVVHDSFPKAHCDQDIVRMFEVAPTHAIWHNKDLCSISSVALEMDASGKATALVRKRR